MRASVRRMTRGSTLAQLLCTSVMGLQTELMRAPQFTRILRPLRCSCAEAGVQQVQIRCPACNTLRGCSLSKSYSTLAAYAALQMPQGDVVGQPCTCQPRSTVRTANSADHSRG